MTNLDDALRDALSEEDRAYLERIGQEPGPIGALTGVFQGAMAPLNWVLLVTAILCGLGAAFAGWRFVTADELRPLLHWGALTGLAIAAITVIRLWFFMEMHTNRVLRELKRLELQVARLAARQQADPK